MVVTAFLIKPSDSQRSNNKTRQGQATPGDPPRDLHLQGRRGPPPGGGRRAAAGGAWPGDSRSPEEVEGALVDLAALPQALPRVLLLPATQHELLVGPVALRAVVVGRGLQHGRADAHLQRGRAAIGAARLGAGPPRCPGGGRARRRLTHLLHIELLQGGHLQRARHGGGAALLELPSAPARHRACAAGGGAGSAHARPPREAGLSVFSPLSRRGVAMATWPRRRAGLGRHGGDGRPLQRRHREGQVGPAGRGGPQGCPPPRLPLPPQPPRLFQDGGTGLLHAADGHRVPGSAEGRDV